MSAALGLDPLLAALREAGLTVGVAEMARLQQVFALGPRLGMPEDRRLKAVLRAVLVKSDDDRNRFEPVFESWLGRAGLEVSLREAAPSPVPVLPAGRPKRKRPVWRVLVLAILPLAVLMLGDRVSPKPPALPPDTVKPIEPGGVRETTLPTLEEIRKRTFTAWVPTLTVTPGKRSWRGWTPLTLGCLALLTAGGVWRKLRRRSWLPEKDSEPAKKGPPRVFLSLPEGAGPQLLQPEEQDALVWGIGHFVADERTRRLDLPATVRETARAGGIPHLRFHQARHPREVWLWIDEAADDPAIPLIAAEIAAALQTYGLPVELALFRGVPDWLVSAAGQAFAPNEVDERRDAALVAILTDGRILARHHAADDRRVRLDAVLRGLSHWPRLAFVDFAAEPGDLSAVLAKHSLARITPPELAAFLGSDDSAKRKAPSPVTGDAAWAAACAVAPSSVDEPRAFQLRKRLGLATSPWALRDLRAQAPGPLGRLQWQPEKRADLVNWLRAAEAHSENEVAPGSLLARALDFWEEVYDREIESRKTADGSWLDFSLNTPAHQHLVMERALLGLWRDPSNAARDLFRLHRGALREVIEQKLFEMSPADYGEPRHAHLPWAWAERSGAEQLMLEEMKLGGGMRRVTLRRPGRFWLGLGLCLGLAAGALTITVLSGWRQPEGLPIVLHGPGRPEEAWERIAPASVTLGTHKSLVDQPAPAGATVDVQWKERSLPCVAKLANGGEVWSCGTLEAPPARLQGVDRRVVVLATSPETPEAAEMAVDLLDSGSADHVILDPDWRRHENHAGEERFVLPDSQWSRLRPALRFTGTRPVREAWPGLDLLAGDPSAQLQGLQTCRTGELLEEGGMTFVHVCPGTFTMGSAKDDPQADDDEKPAHQVTLSEYWIGRTEVTNAQYRADGFDTLPATRVSWDEAKIFCESHGWRLPTEAEWEHAARAGTRTPWSFGDRESRLGEFAWYGGNSGLDPHPVGTKKPNRWGLFDMHGNAWEWVGDWHALYEPGAQKNPTGPETGERRAVRGGSFNVSPWDLRSANRYRFRPSYRFRLIGFRCARGPGRQP